MLNVKKPYYRFKMQRKRNPVQTNIARFSPRVVEAGYWKILSQEAEEIKKSESTLKVRKMTDEERKKYLKT